jgi:hypothetical protein
MQNMLDALIIALEVFCFKAEVAIQDFISFVTNMHDANDKLGIPFARFPA